MSTPDGPRWQQPNFTPYWKKPSFLVPLGAFAVACGVLVYGANAGHPNASPTPSVSTPAYTPTPSKVPPSEPLPTITVTVTPSTPQTTEKPTKGLPSVTELGGAKLKFIRSSASSGTFLAKAVTSDNFNLLTLRCEEDTSLDHGVPYARLFVVDENDTVQDDTYSEFGYPEAIPNPCDGSEVKPMSKTMTQVYYRLLLGAALVNR